MSDLDGLLIAGAVLVLAALFLSLRRLHQRRVFYDAYTLDQQAANEAWSQHRDEAAWAAVRLAEKRGELPALDPRSRRV